MKKQTSTYDYKQSPFFNLTTKKNLAAVLKVALEDLDSLQGLNKNYRKAWLHKKDKKKWLNEQPDLEQSNFYRQIDLPPEELKAVQKRIERLLSRITIPDNIYSPTKGRSYVDNAKAHLAAKAIYSMDIENYFPNTSRSKVTKYFKNTMLCSDDVAAIISNLASKDNGLPQGSPCSPILAYLANKEMWDEITDKADKGGLISTIYADDLTISGNTVPVKTIYEIKLIIRKFGMSVKSEKDKSSYKRPSKITGVIVNDGKLLLPNDKHLKIKEATLDVRNAKTEKEKVAASNKLRSRHSQKHQIQIANKAE